MTETFANGYALLIGVGESAYSRLSLPVTVKDTQAIYGALIEPELCGYEEKNIKILNNKEATKQAILEGLQWLQEKAENDPQATIFVYYSGHGWVDTSDRNYYLLQHDIKPMKLAASALSATEFTDNLRQIQSERLLVVIDSCYAAGMASSKDVDEILEADADLLDEFETFQSVAPSKGLISDLKQGKGRVVFTSSEGEQKSWIQKDDSLSIYTYHFLEALQGAGNQVGDTVVKVSNLMNYLGKTVPETVQSLYNVKQTPHFDLDGNDFAIAKLRGGKGLPDKGWDEVKSEAKEVINKIIVGRDYQQVNASGSGNTQIFSQSGSVNVNK
ncbi:MAG: caspase family protein [Gomphosphaeria aponina SAG 52.96 = DSM 107014]|uniref:Caspase family protein n=1 Tax=Gomphosphaeria aponina SAG 52.96 = DSM 107014 TaxID=1521640 RepID=A0A941GS89_9CHRO|nr:caspase family protein [Gomphosphaeria aponina SAG 52.96 = DSM 107014]